MRDLITQSKSKRKKVGKKSIIMCVKDGLKQNNCHKELSKLSPQCSQTCRNVLVLRCHQLDEYQVLKMEGDDNKKKVHDC